jgi:hypothetical protein
MGGATIAYAIGINFNLSVDVQPVYAFGNYGPVSLEPMFYNLVTGTIQIIRLANAKNRYQTQLNSAKLDTLSGADSKDITDAAVAGVGAAANASSDTANSVLGVGFLHMHLDPTQVLASSLFDIQIYLKVPTVSGSGATLAADVNHPAVPATSSTPATEAGPTLSPWLSIRGCRLNARNVNITMGQIVNEPVSFTGLYETGSLTI